MQPTEEFGLKKRLLLIAVFTLYFIFTYKGIQHYTITYQTPHPLVLPGERAIPFWPLFFPIYLLVYAVPVVGFLLLPKLKDAYRAVVIFFVASLVHYAFFLGQPVIYILRPDLTTQPSSFLIRGLDLFYAFDAPVNCFPSMHVSFAFITYFILRRFRSEAAVWILFLSVLIAISTLVVKQHYIVDIIAAIVLAKGMDLIFHLSSKKNTRILISHEEEI